MRKRFEVDLQIQRTICVIVDDEDLMPGEEMEDVAEELATENFWAGDADIVDDSGFECYGIREVPFAAVTDGETP